MMKIVCGNRKKNKDNIIKNKMIMNNKRKKTVRPQDFLKEEKIKNYIKWDFQARLI